MSETDHLLREKDRLILSLSAKLEICSIALTKCAEKRSNIPLAAQLVHAALWDHVNEMPTRAEFHKLCGLMREAAVFIRG